MRTEFGDRLRYVFRHRPLAGSDIARRAAELAEAAPTPERFWDAHVALMSRSTSLTEEDLGAVAQELGLAELRDRRGGPDPRRGPRSSRHRCLERLCERRALRAHLLHQRPPLRRCVGRELASRTRCSARWAIACAPPRSSSRAGRRRPGSCCCSRRDRGRWLRTRPWDRRSTAFWHAELGLILGEASRVSLLHWVNDGLLTCSSWSSGSRSSASSPSASLAAPAVRRAADRRGDRRDGHAGADLPRTDTGRAVRPWLGRADGHRHRVRGCADRDAGRAGSGRAARIPDGRRDRRRHRRDHRGGNLLFGRAAARLHRRRRGVLRPRSRC